MCLHSFAFEDMQDWHVVRWQFCFEAMLSDDLDGVMESSALTASASGLRCLGSIMQFLKICSWLELCLVSYEEAGFSGHMFICTEFL